MIISNSTVTARFCIEKDAFSGVKKIAEKVAGDLKLVTGKDFEIGCPKCEYSKNTPKIMVATLGHSEYLTALQNSGKIDLSGIDGKWETYIFDILPPADGEDFETLLIAGSDKRGTIYGLFRLSEIIGVSPWVWFADAAPAKKDVIEITKAECLVSKEPSVKYRGFFINDEWPSFGNWTFEHFDGFTVKMYEHVFELLLRLKGNYLWPAMWTSNFSLDGPGLANAELADELGVVMSNSHHEPCLRHSEEWDMVKGDDTPYGSAWNFDRNRAGLTNYWREGLKRNGKFENIITMGMRGERDSELFGAEATLKDNIDYIKDVMTTQNDLIREVISEDLSKVPRMLAIYKEVEKYFNGDEKTEGLKSWRGLDGITCMLCEDNHGNLRFLPEKNMREREGGWGMYYHFDYHGGPISYEWINSTHIARTCEQMTQAYDFGVKEIWIVNVGDLKPQELPLSYFLDLAYDVDKWGQGNPNAIKEYMKKWVAEQFPEAADSHDEIIEMLDGYTRINNMRRPEMLNEKIYHVTNYGEAAAMYKAATKLEATAEKVMAKVKGTASEDAFYQLVYYPVCATANLLKLQITAGQNNRLARMGAMMANRLADEVTALIDRDHVLTDAYHSINGGKWNHLMRSEHIGFTSWNDEECAYPVRMLVQPANKPRMIVTAGNKDVSTCGGDWTKKKLVIEDFLDVAATESFITVYNGTEAAFDIEISSNAEWLKADSTKLTVDEQAVIKVSVDRDKLKSAIKARLGEQEYDEKLRTGDAYDKAVITVKSDFAKVETEIIATASEQQDGIRVLPVLPKDIFEPQKANASRWGNKIRNELGLKYEMDELVLKAGSKGEYKLIENFGKYDNAIKAFPCDETFTAGVNAPSAELSFILPDFMHIELEIITAPCNPTEKGGRVSLGVKANDEAMEIVPTVGMNYEGGENSCGEWCVGVLDQKHSAKLRLNCIRGKNTITLYAVDPGLAIERVLIRQADTEWAEGYIGKLPERLG
ncbi:MAG: glycosyl hydrolase 115 family protein [Lachnospiraceae bacterium]|nr:glycosyl hydrolase 115 family protein [Lachnospiraceae bacterium]